MHLFTDGSCTSPRYQPLALASWAVISATQCAQITAGPLPGEVQCNNRAELYAVIVAAQWTQQQRCHTHLWTDSAYTANGTWQLQHDNHNLPYHTHTDLWRRLASTLADLDPEQFQVHHTPAHGSPDDQSDPVDAWLARWNNTADTAAKAANQQRGQPFQDIWAAYEKAELDQLHRLRHLQALHLAIATVSASAASAADLPEDADPPLEHSEAPLSWTDSLDPNWNTTLHGSQLEFKSGSLFPACAIRWLLQEADSTPNATYVSWLECTVALRLAAIRFPVPTPHSSGEVWRDQSPHVNVQTTLTADIRMVRFFFRLCAAQFGLDLDEVRGLNLSTVGVAPPQAGLALKITRAHRQWVSRELRAFCLGRPIRSANDLARPFRHQS